ncbi:MAG: hypothetical protein A3B78_02230 [Omnitrophica WOR_2 bacterium RIFCSPHIGHO2_02_FULL_67_20]|nr:MAG: hypothetical protein A3B78_02230 [Omnitrophica WOR_2 bacterium RIFCSPHIGHO2_02_FULL_67_20]
MRYDVIFAPEAVKDAQRLKPHLRPLVREAIEQSLRHAPARVSKSRIKRLRGVSRPQFRLRAGEVRVFYDVHATTVDILAIVPKSEAARWLKQEGTRE